MTFTARRWKALAAGLAGGALGAALFASAPAASAAPADPGNVPTNLHVASETFTDLNLAWNAPSSGGSGVYYELFVDNNPYPKYPLTTPAVDVELGAGYGLRPGTTHTFQVEALGGNTGSNAFSNKLTVTLGPGDTTPPTTPTNLHVVSNDSRGIGLAWNPSTDDQSGLGQYYLDGQPCSPVDEGTATQVIVPSINSDPVCGIFPGQTYTFTVHARDNVGNFSADSNAVTVTFRG
jgi:hypothetical protein